MEWKHRKTHYEAVSSALNFPFLKDVSQNSFVFDVVNFEKWGSVAELLRFWRRGNSKIEKFSQNCLVFDVANFEKWRSLAELLRFWRCQVEILRKSRRIASFLMLPTLKNDEVSQNCFVFDVVKFKHCGSLAELLRFWCCQVQNIAEVSQNTFVFKLADRQVDR